MDKKRSLSDAQRVRKAKLEILIANCTAADAAHQAADKVWDLTMDVANKCKWELQHFLDANPIGDENE